jgi:Zn-dependent metalloprotease
MKSEFQCEKADDIFWDLFTSTGGYSPRNEVFLYATQFVDMWNELMGDSVQPYYNSTSYLNFYVHYGSGYQNAFFEGTAFYFGDG